MTDTLPEGSIAYREYEVTMPDFSKANLGFTLGDKNADRLEARFAAKTGALAFGLVSVVGVPDAPQYPVVWTHNHTQLGITVAEEDKEMSKELKVVVARYIAVFFADIADVAPELAALELQTSSAANDRTLN
jgi:hypothetical protein